MLCALECCLSPTPWLVCLHALSFKRSSGFGALGLHVVWLPYKTVLQCFILKWRGSERGRVELALAHETAVLRRGKCPTFLRMVQSRPSNLNLGYSWVLLVSKLFRILSIFINFVWKIFLSSSFRICMWNSASEWTCHSSSRSIFRTEQFEPVLTVPELQLCYFFQCDNQFWNTPLDCGERQRTRAITHKLRAFCRIQSHESVTLSSSLSIRSRSWSQNRPSQDFNPTIA